MRSSPRRSREAQRRRRSPPRPPRTAPRSPTAAATAQRPGYQPGDRRQGREREDRPQRSLLVRLGQEVQEVPRGLAGAAIAVLAAVAALLVPTGEAESAQRGVAISGRAYAFNHMDTFLAGATIRVRELPGLSATTDANGDYVARGPRRHERDPVHRPPGRLPPDRPADVPHPRRADRERQLPDARRRRVQRARGAAPVPLGPDGRPQQCAIVTTASARNVRGVDYETFHGARRTAWPARPPTRSPGARRPIYFNEYVIPDRSQPATSGDGGIIWTEVPAGDLSGDHRRAPTPVRELPRHLQSRAGSSTRTRPWGAYELSPGERPLGAGVVAASVTGTNAKATRNGRVVVATVESGEATRVNAVLRRAGKRVGHTRVDVGTGSRRVRVPVRSSCRQGQGDADREAARRGHRSGQHRSSGPAARFLSGRGRVSSGPPASLPRR